jgi:hypothetical protein
LIVSSGRSFNIWFRQLTIGLFDWIGVLILIAAITILGSSITFGHSSDQKSTIDNQSGLISWGPYLTESSPTSIMINARSTMETILTAEYSSEDYFNLYGSYDLAARDKSPAILHHISLKDLKPDTVYHYRLVYGKEATKDYYFRTFPVSGPFTFIVLSDTQDELPNFSQYDRYKLVADKIAAEPDVAFVLHCGDQVNNGSDITDWDRYFDASRDLMAGTPIYPASGNHNGGDSLYNQAFGVPAYYSFDCAGVHFTVLDTNDDVSLSDQTNWLANDLSSHPGWKFISFHYPLYTSESNHFGGWENFRNAWENIFIKNGVNGVWNGHIHAYERYFEKSINYMVIGTGGGPPVNLPDLKYTGYRNGLVNSLAYAKVTVDAQSNFATVQIIRVAEILEDNKQVTMVYSPETEFENFVISRTGFIRPDWDLNDDNVCNQTDAAEVELHWGESGKAGWIQEDLNHDGVIGLADLVWLGLHWSEKV